MKKVTMFYLQNCPHCKKASQIIEDLKSNNPKYDNIIIDKIEESQNVQVCAEYDYYYVPTFYVDNVKIHEGVPNEEKIESVLKAAL
ncbi:glutaredoxin family protein [Sedimentibacter sp. MB31-C6]|uniref:glutaredoxin family protein n=1 Tax=Sedimentibacter sp. MB31-C6 TaxID=3109366 RepID=UPI002DDD72FB|nr:thioredoxin family protein [Sedimentibacter sp. MB36-C1]WSI04471.1 thioredoxin family protein [Sedimentibacter sp. MB36-C1]